MISASYLDSVADEVEILYSTLHQDILKDIARRVKKTGVLTATANWQVQMLLEQGQLRNDVIKKIAEFTGSSQTQIKKIFSDTLLESYKANSYGLSEEQFLSYSRKALLVGLGKTNATLSNMTGIISNNTAGVFEQVCTRAYMQASSGAFTYEQVSAFASDELLRQDIQKIVYSESGRRTSIEGATRRAIVTGLNQTVCESMLDVAKGLGTNLVETTAHYGAREEHQVWQGQIFSLVGSTKNYPNFYTSTGYGSVTGLGGANCRHNFHPYIEGDSRQYSREQIDKWNDDTVTFNGKEMTYYDATQTMRNYERNIRKLKKEKGVHEQMGADVSGYNKQLRAYAKKARELNKQTSVPLDYSRRRIARY